MILYALHNVIVVSSMMQYNIHHVMVVQSIMLRSIFACNVIVVSSMILYANKLMDVSSVTLHLIHYVMTILCIV